MVNHTAPVAYLPCEQYIANISTFLDEFAATSQDRTRPLDSAAHIIETIINPIVCIFGILGNTLNLLVLTRKQLKNTMDDMEKSSHLGLVALAVSDLLFCVLSITIHYTISSKFLFTQKDSLLLFYYYIYYDPVLNIVMLASTWFTVVMAMGRYIGICHPLHARGFINLNGTRITIALVCVCSVLANLPKFWRYYPKVTECSVAGNETGIYPTTQCDCNYYMKERGGLYRDRTFVLTYAVVYFILSLGVPFSLLTFCNVCLIRALRQSYKMQRLYRANAPRDSGHRITPTLISLIILFTLLVTPSEIITFIKSEFNATTYPVYFTLNVVFNLFLSINFSINFILYCVINVQFRKTIKTILSCAVKGNRPSPDYTKANHCTMTTNYSECETEM